jgi:hypothetical protein
MAPRFFGNSGTTRPTAKSNAHQKNYTDPHGKFIPSWYILPYTLKVKTGLHLK